MEEENNELTPEQGLQIQAEKLNESTTSLISNLIGSKDPKEIKDLTAEFNIAQAKINMIRSLKLNDLLDQISNKVSERIVYNSGGMKDDDLIKYFKVTQEVLDRSLKNSQTPENIEAIQLNQSNVNINIGDGLNRASREKVVDVVNAILNRVSKESEILEDQSSEYDDNEDANREDNQEE